MKRLRLAVAITAATLAAAPAAPAAATTCGGVLSTHCADSSGLFGHTHGCSTSGSLRTCFVHWHGTSSCNGTTAGTCRGTLNAGADGFASGSCNYAALGNCSFPLTTGRSVTFPLGTVRQSCATLTTTADGGLAGSASETDGTVCFTYS